ncbi:hypothetical protein CRE_22029 [Caenorhabditis remanei]|uniref:F-box domain-containing protein n=1 Tax=Caenorhabditis remanei TaxID=31234 RepID=E3N3G6_CAERE|nr:hypothetical protein CRE_22029 [Caenorhabditis remanei]
MFSPFPLLRLPRLVLCEVFKSLNIGEKIKLSLCSKKVSSQINNARLYSQKVIIDVDCLNHKIRVHSENNKVIFEISTYSDPCKSQNSNVQQFSIAGCSVRVIHIPTRIKTFWKNYREGFLSVIRHLLKMFQCKISISISCYDNDLYQPTMSMLFDLQQEFKRLGIKLEGSEDRQLLWNQISNNLGLVENLSISSVSDPGFSAVFTSWPQKIGIRSSAWITLEHLLECTSTRIILKRSQLENKDLDVILKNWKAGGLPNLEYLEIHSHNITNNGATILGMAPLELRGKVIQSDDGSKRAFIRMSNQSIEMSVTPIE